MSDRGHIHLAPFVEVDGTDISAIVRDVDPGSGIEAGLVEDTTAEDGSYDSQRAGRFNWSFTVTVVIDQYSVVSSEMLALKTAFQARNKVTFKYCPNKDAAINDSDNVQFEGMVAIGNQPLPRAGTQNALSEAQITFAGSGALSEVTSPPAT